MRDHITHHNYPHTKDTFINKNFKGEAMLVDVKQVQKLYDQLEAIHEDARKRLGKPLTYAEKIIISHRLHQF